MKTIVIAEMGENHYGNWEICRAMVEQAAAGGATYAKFQTYTAEEFGRDHPWYDEFRRVAMPTSVHFEMQRLCGEKGIAFLSSAFTKGSVSFLVDKMGRNALKLASSRVNQLDLLDYVNSRADQVRTVYLSTGMATLDEVREAVKHLHEIENLYLLQCTSQYPTEDDNVNLRAMLTLKREFSDQGVGFSDHTRGIDACLAAAALGAEVLEKHFTFHTDMPGDDHAGAMTPEMLGELCARVERIETMLGSDRKGPVPAEQRAREHLRVGMHEVPYE